MTTCSEEHCIEKAVVEAVIHGTSHLTGKRYMMNVNLCKTHLKEEQLVGNIIKELREYTQ